MQKILIINNGSSPLHVPASNNEIEFTHYPISYDSYTNEDFDTYVCKELDKAFENQSFDLIILPYSLTQQPIEYTGLRVAAHIRLTDEWKHMSCPILFLGPDSIEDIMLLSSLGGILSSFNIYTSSKKEDDEICDIAKWINKHCLKISDKDISEGFSNVYMDFINRISSIKTPANYSTHHSVANEWAIMRWMEMFNWERFGKPELPESDFPYMLYFKYLKAKAGTREPLPKKEKKKKSPLIPNITGRRIMLIDDEHNKGWYSLLRRIIEDESGATLIRCEEFDKSKTKKILIEDIKAFISNPDNEAIDCYIVDLRLHDDDFNSNKENNINNELAGIQIINYIKGLNQGNQIIYFTASNKIWNFKKNDDDSNRLLRTIGDNFAIKESPEQNLKTNESYEYFDQLVSAIQHACKIRYLKNNFSTIAELEEKCTNNEVCFSKIDLFNRIMVLNDGERFGDLVDSAALSLSSFIESHIDDNFELFDNTLIRNGKPIGTWNNKFKFNVIKDGKHLNVLSMDYSMDGLRAKTDNPRKILLNEGDSEWFYPNLNSPITKIVVALKMYYQFSNDMINDYIKLKFERNKNIAHGSEMSTISADFLQKKIFENIVVGILNKDINDSIK